MTALYLTAIIRKEDDIFTSWCPEIDVASQGESQEIAISNLKEAIDLLLENTYMRDKIIGDFGELMKTCPVFSCLEIHTS